MLKIIGWSQSWWKVRLISRVEKALGCDIEYCNFTWFCSMDRGNFVKKCSPSIFWWAETTGSTWVVRRSLTLKHSKHGGVPEHCGQWQGARYAGAARCSGCATLSCLLFALSQAHWIAGAKYSFAFTSGMEVCTAMFNLCNDCRVFLEVYLHFLKSHEAQTCTRHGPVVMYQACIWAVAQAVFALAWFQSTIYLLYLSP